MLLATLLTSCCSCASFKPYADALAGKASITNDAMASNNNASPFIFFLIELWLFLYSMLGCVMPLGQRGL